MTYLTYGFIRWVRYRFDRAPVLLGRNKKSTWVALGPRTQGYQGLVTQVGTTCDTLAIVKLKFVASGSIPNVLQGRITLQLATVFFHSATFLGLCVSRVAVPLLAGLYLCPNHKGSATRLLKHLTETPDIKLFDNLTLLSKERNQG